MKRRLPVVGGMAALFLSGLLLSSAQERDGSQDPENKSARDQIEANEQAVVEHAECVYFGPQRARFLSAREQANAPARRAIGRLTQNVTAQLSFVPGGSRTKSFERKTSLGTIDRFIFADIEAAGVTPAAKTTDPEFLRRATLDLTGRIPTADAVTAFLADGSADKRSKLVDDLLNRPEWSDKWAMFFGDLYQNTVVKPSVNLQRYVPGRNAFWKWIKDSLVANKPYDQMARELIVAQGPNSWTQGDINWVLGAWVINNPQQDNWDQAAANVAETFLGIGHMNCVLCHNGRGHLDALSLWGKGASRTEGYGLAAFFSRTTQVRQRVNNPDGTANPNVYYWSQLDNPRMADYPLNTTTGNRPTRAAIGTTRNFAPMYPFSGRGPKSGENYRTALAREVTSDFQFARATVNYLWKQFFGVGIVEPVNQFDPARLDPDNPPPEPWKLQPSNARMLNALAQEFIDSNYDLKSLMRQIANSETYQLSSRYEGEWNLAWDALFARKQVRRLWAEEIHDAVVQSSNILPTYNLPDFSSHPNGSLFAAYPTYGSVSLAMQFPDVVNMPDRGAMGQFLDSFVRGDRDGEDRRPEGSLLQALNLMNDNFVVSRIRATGPATSLLARNMRLPDDQLVTNLYLAVLSRYPSESELAASVAAVRQGNRNTSAENLLWSLYNKVDFIFNY